GTMRQRVSRCCMRDRWPKRSERKSRSFDNRTRSARRGFVPELLRFLCMGTAPQPLARKSPDPCACAGAHSPATAIQVLSDRDPEGSAESPENRIRFPRLLRIPDSLPSRMAASTGRIAPVNVCFQEKMHAQSCGICNGNDGNGTPWVPYRAEFWDRTRHHRPVAQCDRKPRCSLANNRRREYHHSHESLREDSRRCLRIASAACRRTWSECRHRHAL